MESSIIESPMFNVIKITKDSATYWKLEPATKLAKELPFINYITHRWYFTKGQAYIALGIIESIYYPKEDINPDYLDFLTKAINRLITGNDWEN